ncbi:MAG: hypothetical protein IJI22_01950 [Bacilli bacterium]|nr:hypothetical protein [Bacilli bacterium]
MKKNRLNILLTGLLVCFVFFMLSRYILDNDYFWHIKAGEYMFNNGILRKDVFSWYLQGKYWMSHEWLFEIFLYTLKVIFGKIHVFVYCFLCLAILIFSLFYPNRKSLLKNLPFTLIYIIFFFLIFLGFVQARPHLLSFSLFSFGIYSLFDLYNNEDSKKVYFLPLITVFWANFHGGSSNLIYLLCFIFIICGLFSFNYKKIEANRINSKQIKKYLIVMLLCMVCVLINVHGLKMFIYPYQNIMDSSMVNNITEWRNTSLSSWYDYVYYFFVIFVLAIMLFSDKKINFVHLIIFMFTVYLGLKSIRFWPYAYITAIFFIYDYVKKRKIDRGSDICILFFSVLLLVYFCFGIGDRVKVLFKLSLNDEIVEIIKEEKPSRLYNLYDYGGELIYHDIDVFIDGRADLYSKYNYKDALDISRLTGDYEKLISKYDFDYFLVSKEYPINTYLKYSDKYQLIYKNKEVYFYKKKNS